MDISALSTSLASVDLGSKVGAAVLSNALKQNEVQGAGLVAMIDAAAMERSVNPAIGSNFDMKV